MSDETKRDDGGPAFPMSGAPDCDFDRGMSLRDWFAGMAMSGMMADQRIVLDARGRALVAYDMADEMIAARGGVQ